MQTRIFLLDLRQPHSLPLDRILSAENSFRHVTRSRTRLSQHYVCVVFILTAGWDNLAPRTHLQQLWGIKDRNNQYQTVIIGNFYSCWDARLYSAHLCPHLVLNAGFFSVALKLVHVRISTAFKYGVCRSSLCTEVQLWPLCPLFFYRYDDIISFEFTVSWYHHRRCHDYSLQK